MESLPFASFFHALRRNGFSITHTQVINAYKIILKYNEKATDDSALCSYLAPVFVSSENEQRLFREIFNAEFRTAEPLKLRKSLRQRMDLQGKRHPLTMIGIYGLIALLLVGVIIFSYRNYNNIDESQVRVYLEHIDSDDDYRTNGNVFHAKVDSEVSVNVYCHYKDQLQSNFTSNVQYNWGDGQKPTGSSKHIYRSAGEYQLSANVEVLYNNNFIKREIISYRVIVCPAATLVINVSGDDTVVPLGRKIILRSLVSQLAPGNKVYIEWKEGNRILGQNKTLGISFNAAGDHTINCTAIFDDMNSCALEKSIVIRAGGAAPKVDTVYSKTINSTETPKTEPATATFFQQDKTFLYGLYLLLAVIFCGLSIYFFVLYQKAIQVKTGWKSKDTDETLQLIFSPAQQRLSKTLLFKHNDELAIDMPVFSEIAKPLRSRINDHISFLHVKKTIQKTINAGGMFQLVKAPRTRPPAYLILIDENAGNYNMVKLFEYLAGILKKQNIEIEKFFFNNDPLHCYNVNEPEGVSLDKLSAKYNKHVLLIFGDAHQLIATDRTIMKEEYFEIIRHWQYKAIVTPVPYPDWDLKEYILAETLPLLPADIEGLVTLSQVLLNEKQDAAIAFRLKAMTGNFYKVSGIDFENADELAAYCNHAAWACVVENGVPVNVMFEWIKALAIYPKVHWEVLIAIGKSVLEKYKMPSQLNFTNLLMIARISWIKQGVFPDEIRLELLKSISTGNELIARETILKLLDEIPQDEVPQHSAAYSEREMQKLLNEFNLYGHDPAVYHRYRKSKELFESIWRNDHFNDVSTKLYLTNKEGAWQTLLQYGTGIEKYFETVEIEETNLSRTYLWLTLISVFVFVSSFFAILILYRWDAVGI